MKKSWKIHICVALLCMLALIWAAPAPAQAAQDREWTTYNLPAGVQPAAVVTVGSLAYVGTNHGLYKGIDDSWTQVDTGSVSLGLVRGLAYDPVDQKMYVSDPDHTRVLIWDMVENTWSRFTTRDFDSRGLSCYRDGGQYRVYVAERTDNYVFEFRGASGYGNLSTDTDPIGAMVQPYDAVKDGDTLYVADRGNDRILVRDPDFVWSEIVHTHYTQDVTDLAVLSDGTLYFSEYYNDRVMKYADGHYTIVMAGSALVDGPWGVYADEWDNLFICDRLNGRILRSQDDNDRLAGIAIDGEPIPGFSPDTAEYTITCDYRTESIDLTAEAQSPYAIVSGTGAKALTVGENHFAIRVDPELGTHRNYDLYIIRPEPPNPAYTAALTADMDTIEIGETVTFTLTIENTGDVGFTDVDAVNTISTEHAIADLMLGVGETKAEEITITAEEEDVESGIRLAYDVIGHTAMGHEIHVSTGVCTVTVNGATPEPTETPDAAAIQETPDNTGSPDTSGSPDAGVEAIAEENPPEEPGGVGDVLLWAGGGVLLLLLVAVTVLLILLAKQKKKGQGGQTAAEEPPLSPDEGGTDTPAQTEDTEDTPQE